MKTFTRLFILMAFFTTAAFAQPTVSNNEYYRIGDVYQFINTSFSDFNSTDSGAAQTWDFSRLSGSGIVSIYITQDTASGFGISNILITYPDGTKQHVRENNTDSYINASVSPSTGLTYIYDTYDDSRRPLSYLSNVVDSYDVNETTTLTHGVGHMSIRGDAYGTLILPNGTYHNVLRVRKYQYESDTVERPSTYYTYSTATTYQWFDGIHNAPLLEIDSNTNATGTTQTVRYLTSSSGVATVTEKAVAFNGYLNNNSLIVSGMFEQQQPYRISLTDMNGKTVFGEEFAASGDVQQFNIGENIAAGIYIARIAPTDNNSLLNVFKVVKN